MTKSDKRRGKEIAEVDDYFKRARNRALVMYSFAVVALAVGIQHLLAHAGWRPIPIGMGKQDLLIGYPTAGLIGLAAVYMWGTTPGPK
ncbi:hypothetical protein BH09ACT10_BH09ACT10_00190 [soil metagenome]